ncbi:MAG TPA: GTPase Era [Burkholderiales bacterium]|nr:GTPase Era [Burkholderiales bacterium]HYA46889.1 GTPase Era [Burkholderiales bacterium]
MSVFRCGTIAIVGRPNTGKSTLLNRLVGEKLSIVSPKAQTTRHVVTGILNEPECQFVFLDAPGLQERERETLHRMLNRRALEIMRGSDIVVFVVEAGRLGIEDRQVLAHIPREAKPIVVVNKVDRMRQASQLLPFVERLARERDFHAIVPVSAKTGKNIPELLRVLRAALPEAPRLFPPEQLTDRDERFFAAELLREKLFQQLGEELPYRCEVLVESFREDGRLRRVEAAILVDKESQKGIVVGAGGARLKRIAEAARKDMERLFGGKVYLGVWVKVRRGWSDNERVLRQLGYGS